MTKTLAELGVLPGFTDRLTEQGIHEAFPIQELAIPMALKGADVIGQARTGTGKTLAFGLPLLQRVDADRARTQALVITPTRELAIQVAGDLGIGAEIGVDIQLVYGGVGYDEQIAALTGGVNVVVGTPGRLLDHLGRGNLDLSGVTELVLDEADEMLDMGFLPDVERLIEACPDKRHTMLFSATVPGEIVKLARRYMSHPTFLRTDTEDHEVAPTVDQHFFLVHRMDKPRILARILQSPDRGGAYVFTRTKRMADRLVGELDKLGMSAIAVHGDKRQATRERNMDKFRDGEADVLVATEVAARGLDVDNVTHVINYDCPDDEKMYVHRIGRTARAGNEGVAVTFAEFNQVDRLNVIRRAVDTDEDVVEVFSTSEELTERFDLPERTPWDHLGTDQSRSRTDDSPPRDDTASRGSGSRGSSSGKRRRARRARSGSANGRPAPASPGTQAEPQVVRTRSRSLVRSDDSGNGDDPSSSRSRTRVRQRQPDAPSDGASEDPGGTSGNSPSRSTRVRTRQRSRPSPATSAQSSGPAPGRRHTGTDRRVFERTTTERIVARKAGTAARGAGNPRLGRPLRVDYLP